MPKVEDFPPVVKAEIEHRSSPHAASHAEERGPMGLLKRLTRRGRKEEEAAPSDMTAGAPRPLQQRRPLSPEASLGAPRRGTRRPGSPFRRSRKSHDDEFDIPASPSRQSN